MHKQPASNRACHGSHVDAAPHCPDTTNNQRQPASAAVTATRCTERRRACFSPEDTRHVCMQATCYVVAVLVEAHPARGLALQPVSHSCSIGRSSMVMTRPSAHPTTAILLPPQQQALQTSAAPNQHLPGGPALAAPPTPPPAPDPTQPCCILRSCGKVDAKQYLKLHMYPTEQCLIQPWNLLMPPSWCRSATPCTSPHQCGPECPLSRH